MISELLQEIANKVKSVAQRVVVVDDPDGLFTTDAVRSRLERLIGFPVVEAEGIALRVHFELNVRRNTEAHVCYVRRVSSPLLWDIARFSRNIRISIAEFFPNYADRQTLASLDFLTLEILYGRHIQGRVTAAKLQQILDDGSQASEPIEESAIDTLRRCADAPDWSDGTYAETLGKTLKKIIARREYDDEVAKLISNINLDFQKYLRDHYFATLNSTGGPKSVHAVAPYMQDRYGTEAKVALVVVDGMAWWQWEVLRNVLEKEKLLPMPEVKAIFSWLPSITALSRQALFRGAAPVIDYRQTPSEEKKLWKNLWKGNPAYAPVYQHNVQSPDKLNTATRRLAIVDGQLDEKMHQSSDYDELYFLTHKWAMEFARIIARLQSEDFKIVLTTDHGNVLAQGVGTLKPVEKVHLYHANSRGGRFVYFNDKEMWRQFCNDHNMMHFFSNPRENWLAIADDACFSTQKKQLITHGGSHFMEVLIPLIIF